MLMVPVCVTVLLPPRLLCIFLSIGDQDGYPPGSLKKSGINVNFLLKFVEELGLGFQITYTVFRKKTPTHVFCYISVEYV